MGAPFPPNPKNLAKEESWGLSSQAQLRTSIPRSPGRQAGGGGAEEEEEGGGRSSGRRGGSEWVRGLTERERSQRVAQRRGGGSKGEGVSEVGSKRGKAPRGVGHLGLRTPQRGPAAILGGFQEAWPASPWESPSHRHLPTWRSGPWTPRVDGQRD